MATKPVSQALVRTLAVPLLLLLTACGSAAESSGGFADASTAAKPSAAEPSEPAVPSAASASAAPETGVLTAVPLPDPDDGQEMGYLAYFPPSYEHAGAPSPLLIFLHGSGEAGVGSEASLELVDDLGIPQQVAAGAWPEELPFVILAPQYGLAEANGECEFGDDLAGFIEWAGSTYNVDPARIYLTGVSCGAIGMWDYLATHGGDVVAAAVPISGHALWALEKSGCVPLAEVPIWAFHGAADDVVPVSFVEEQIEEIGACEGADAPEIQLTVYPETGHVEAIAPTYDGSAGHDIYSWLLEHATD